MRGWRRWLKFIRISLSNDDTDEVRENSERIDAAIADAFAPVKRWVRRRDVWIATLSGLVAGTVLLVFQNIIDNSRFQQSISVENIRYVRELSHPGTQYRPFSSMDLSGQILNGLIIDDADLRGADLSGTEMFDVSAKGAKLEGAIFDKAGIYSSNFNGAILDDVRFYAKIRDSDFTGATFRPKKLRFWQSTNTGIRGIINSNFTGAHFDGANMGNWIIHRTSLRAAHMENTVWGRGQITLSDLRGADFTGATIKSNIFHNICYDDSTVWPAGFDPPPNNPEYCGEPKTDIPGRGQAPWRTGSSDTDAGDP